MNSDSNNNNAELPGTLLSLLSIGSSDESNNEEKAIFEIEILIGVSSSRGTYLKAHRRS